VQSEARRNPQGPAGRYIPSENRRQVMRSVVKTKTVPVTETAIHLDPANEVLPTERAALRGSFQSERTAGAEGIAEFPGRIRKILGRQGVFCDVPALEGAGDDKL